jgi:hypothetical protein
MGRKKGKPNKNTLLFRERLEELDFDFEKELVEAIQSSNMKKLSALQTLLPYLLPKFKEIEVPQTPQQEVEKADEQDIDKLLRIVDNAKK